MEEKKRSYVALYNDMKCELIKEVGLTTAMVYLIIKSHKMIENNMHCCYPSNEELYKECDIQKRQFQKHLNKLVDTGWIVVKSGGTKIGRNSNYYFPKEIGMYTEAELNYISKIERRSTKKEEVPAQDNNVADLVGNEDTNSTDDKIFIPVGKVYNDDLFDEEIEELPPSNDINNSVGYMEEFYINMHNYYNVNDNTLGINKTLISKVNSLIGFIEEELTNNNIDNIKAEKIINDIMRSNQKSFNNALNNKSITDDFKKCTYIISCVQNNFKDKKLKTIINNAKVDKIPVVADDGFVDYMNDNYITLSNGENITKEEAIRRIQLMVTEQNEKTIFNIIFGVIGRNNKLNNCSIDIIKNVVYKLNNYFGYEVLISDRFDGILIEDTPDIAI